MLIALLKTYCATHITYVLFSAIATLKRAMLKEEVTPSYMAMVRGVVFGPWYVWYEFILTMRPDAEKHPHIARLYKMSDMMPFNLVPISFAIVIASQLLLFWFYFKFVFSNY